MVSVLTARMGLLLNTLTPSRIRIYKALDQTVELQAVASTWPISLVSAPLSVLSTMVSKLLLAAVVLSTKSTVGANPLHMREHPYTSPITPPFGLEYVFSAKLSLSPPSQPIPIYGGVAVTEVITHGTVAGPAINATIAGGTAFDDFYENGAINIPTIDVYGTTSDNLSVAVHEYGLGSKQAQLTRLVRIALAALLTSILSLPTDHQRRRR
jgi:hypothetical protein